MASNKRRENDCCKIGNSCFPAKGYITQYETTIKISGSSNLPEENITQIIIEVDQ